MGEQERKAEKNLEELLLILLPHYWGLGGLISFQSPLNKQLTFQILHSVPGNQHAVFTAFAE